MGEINWADSVENLVVGEDVDLEKNDVSKNSTMVEVTEFVRYPIYIKPYEFKTSDEIWHVNICESEAFKYVPRSVKFMMQDNKVIPFQLIKNASKKYLVGDNRVLYEFIDGILTPAYTKDKQIFWEEVDNLKTIKKRHGRDSLSRSFVFEIKNKFEV